MPLEKCTKQEKVFLKTIVLPLIGIRKLLEMEAHSHKKNSENITKLGKKI